MRKLKSRTPAASQIIKTEIICPNDTNPMGLLQGGRLIQWMDITAAACAQTHAGKICVTASINKAIFCKPARVGDVITIQAKVTRVFTTSLEIFVQSFARNVQDANDQLISEAYFTFVSLNDKEPLIPIEPITLSEIEQFNSALGRKMQVTKEISPLNESINNTIEYMI